MSFFVEMESQFRTVKGPDGTRIMERWLARCRSCGYSVTYFQCPHSLYISGHSKVGLYIIGFSIESGGGLRACTWFEKTIRPALEEQRRSGPCCRIWDNAASRNAGVPGILQVDPNDRVQELELAETVEYL